MRMLAGQAKLFFVYPDSQINSHLLGISSELKVIRDATDVGLILATYEQATERIKKFIDDLYGSGVILSHEQIMFRSCFPHYPPCYIDYDHGTFPALTEIAKHLHVVPSPILQLQRPK